MTEQTGLPEPSAQGTATSKAARDRRIRRVFLLTAVVVGVLVYLLIQQRPTKSQWPTDAAAEMAAAKKDGRPTVLVFIPDVSDAATQLLASKSLDRPPVLNALKATNSHYATVPTKRDLSGLAQEYKITELPTVLKLSPAGRELKRHAGFIGESDLAQFIQEAP